MYAFKANLFLEYMVASSHQPCSAPGPDPLTTCDEGRVACGELCALPCDGFLECDDGADETIELCRNNVCRCVVGLTRGLKIGTESINK